LILFPGYGTIIRVKERLDTALVKRGLAQSRERAKALIMEGKVIVDGRPVMKAGAQVNEEADITVKGSGTPYVSRGGLKLMAAIERFGISLEGKAAMDIGASTGGFTDCMLKEGARKVYAVDVGYGQFHWALRNDPRVVLIERTNIRYLQRERIPDEMDIITVDASFISLKLVLPKAMEFLGAGGGIIALIKPQFEVGPKDVGKGGIVRDEAPRLRAVEEIKGFSEGIGLQTIGLMESPVAGHKGNIEYFIYLRRQ